MAPALSTATSLLTALVGLAAGVCITLAALNGGTPSSATMLARELAEARRTVRVLRAQLALQRQPSAQLSQSSSQLSQPSAQQPSAARWTDTPDNRKLHATLSRVANARGEVMLAIANDVMMCTNRKTCWWNGGNVLETFLKSTTRLKISNTVIITLDDESEKFCQNFGVGVTSLRLELPVVSCPR